jgi:hypothetical protein
LTLDIFDVKGLIRTYHLRHQKHSANDVLIKGGKSMILEIGIIAGDIWHYLDEKGEVMLSRLIKAIKKPRDVVLMSLGWLAREGHVVLEGTKDFKITLRK